MPCSLILGLDVQIIKPDATLCDSHSSMTKDSTEILLEYGCFERIFFLFIYFFKSFLISRQIYSNN